jgi:NTE family protein
MTRPLLGIALGGGGVRGAAHVGVLQEIDNAGIKVDRISGVSAGAVIGCLYAYSLDGKWVEDHFREIWSSQSFNGLTSKIFFDNGSKQSFAGGIKKTLTDHVIALMSLHRSSLIKNDQLRDILKMLIPIQNFDQLKIPLKIISTDIESGEDVISEKGNLIDALLKSCSIPGVMEPIMDDGRVIVDGGVSMPIPIPPLAENCDVTVAVDIGVYKFNKLKNPNAKSIKIRSDIITSNRLKLRLVSDADLVIRPDTRGLHWSRFDAGEILLKNGKREGRKQMPFLNDLISKKSGKLANKE